MSGQEKVMRFAVRERQHSPSRAFDAYVTAEKQRTTELHVCFGVPPAGRYPTPTQ